MNLLLRFIQLKKFVLTPKIVDSLWFAVDKPKNDDSELVQQEQEYQSWLNSIGQRDCDLAPIGKTASECQDEEEEDEEEDDNDDDESDTHDEEDEDVDMELNSYDVSDNRQMPAPADTSV